VTVGASAPMSDGPRSYGDDGLIHAASLTLLGTRACRTSRHSACDSVMEPPWIQGAPCATRNGISPERHCKPD